MDESICNPFTTEAHALTLDVELRVLLHFLPSSIINSTHNSVFFIVFIDFTA